jgi:hypothetical protein
MRRSLESGGRFSNEVTKIRRHIDIRPSLVAIVNVQASIRSFSSAHASPFLLLGLVYVLSGGGAGIAVPIFTIFIVARIEHSIVYLRAMQPDEPFLLPSLLAIFALMAAVLHVLLTA